MLHVHYLYSQLTGKGLQYFFLCDIKVIRDGSAFIFRSMSSCLYALIICARCHSWVRLPWWQSPGNQGSMWWRWRRCTSRIPPWCLVWRKPAARLRGRTERTWSCHPGKWQRHTEEQCKWLCNSIGLNFNLVGLTHRGEQILLKAQQRFCNNIGENINLAAFILLLTEEKGEKTPVGL